MVNQVVLIIIDDVRASHLFGLVNQGKIPNIANLIDNGISCQNCITSFPSVTFPCYPNIITGTYSGYYPKEGSGVPSYHWIAREDPVEEGKRLPFMRNYDIAGHLVKINKDLGKNAKTIFEQVGDGDYLSAFNFVSRGSQFRSPSEAITVDIFKIVEKAYISPKREFHFNDVPKISIIYIAGTDKLMHEKGFDSQIYINEIINCDKGLGNLIKVLKSQGYYDDTAIGIISDHGNYKAQKFYDIEPYFRKLGLKQYNPRNNYGDFDANMGSVGFFNFRGETWHYHPSITQLENFKPSGSKGNSINLFEKLKKVPGVKYMYYRDDNNSPDKGAILIEKIDNSSGKVIKARIEYEGHGREQKTKYIFESEVFGYQNHMRCESVLDGNQYSIEEWLSATYNIDFPMFVDQLPRYFKNPRSCDILISTCGEYGFNYEHGKTGSDKLYSHDIAQKASMTVPFIIGGSPDIPKLELDYCKTTDAVPTLLDLLGISPHKSVVGTSILKP